MDTPEAPCSQSHPSLIVLIIFPLLPQAKIRWGLFLDAGMIGQSEVDQIKRGGTGAIIEWISPVGPLQFIFSKALNNQPGDSTTSFEFSLGSTF